MNSADTILDITPELLAILIKKNPEVVRSGLEILLAEDPIKYSSIAPQVIDMQTMLYSKTFFENYLLPRAIENAEKCIDPLCYAITDLDNFHDFNLNFGLGTGDIAIKGVADLLMSENNLKVLGKMFKRNFRTEARRSAQKLYCKEMRQTTDRRTHYKNFDYIARILETDNPKGRVGGGEEFGIIFYGCDEQTALFPMERFVNEVSNLQIPYSRDFIKVTLSAGVAQYERGISKEELKKRAEKALRWSKEHGKNITTLYSDVPADYVPTISKRI